MFANTKILAVVAAVVVAAQAQNTTTPTTVTASASSSQTSAPAGLDTCILDCVSTAATQNGCASYTDLACVCTSTAFQGAALACLQANCTAQDVATATTLQQQECAAYLSSAPASGASTAPGTAGASTHASTTAAPTSTAKSGASMLTVPYSFETLFGVLVTSAGALIGGAFVL